jgi:hypothetical protein
MFDKPTNRVIYTIALRKLIKDHVDCPDLRVVCEYSAMKQSHCFTISSMLLNFRAESYVSESVFTISPMEAVVEIGRTFLAEFKVKHPKRYVD